MPRNSTVFLLTRRLTRSAIYGSQISDSHMADRVSSQSKRKTTQFRGIFMCGSLYYTFKTSFQPYAFHNKRLQKLFIDQLCSFNIAGHKSGFAVSLFVLSGKSDTSTKYERGNLVLTAPKPELHLPLNMLFAFYKIYIVYI